MGTRSNEYPQYMFEQKYEKSQNISTENCHFNSREKSQCIACAYFRNEHVFTQCMNCFVVIFFHIFALKQRLWVLVRQGVPVCVSLDLYEMRIKYRCGNIMQCTSKEYKRN